MCWLKIYLDQNYASQWIQQAAKMEEEGKLSLRALEIFSFSGSNNQLEWGAASKLFKEYKIGKYFYQQVDTWKETFTKHIDKYGFGYFYFYREM